MESTYNKVKQEITDSQPESRADFPGDEDDEGKGPFGGGGSGRQLKEAQGSSPEVQFRHPGSG